MICKHLSSKSKYNPVIWYKNALVNKKTIFAENKKKCLVYRWVNNINGKTYIGSTINFQSRRGLAPCMAKPSGARFYKLYNVEYLKRRNTPLYSVLLKYNFYNFSLDIIEYCDKKDLLKKNNIISIY